MSEEVLKTQIVDIKERQKEESEKHEQYRIDVHDRLTKTHGMFLIHIDKNNDKSVELTRRIDSVEHSLQNQGAFIAEFKKAVVELTQAVNSIKTYIAKNDTRRGLWHTMFLDGCRLAAFVLAVLAILKYRE